MKALCQYLVAPEVAETLGVTGWRPVQAERSLCAWGAEHPDAPAVLTLAPPFVQRQAIAGYLVKPDQDCPRCPYFAAGPPIE